MSPKDYFKCFRLEGYHDAIKPSYDALDEATKSEFKALFDGEDVMKDVHSMESWENENEDDDEAMQSAMDGVRAYLSGGQQ